MEFSQLMWALPSLRSASPRGEGHVMVLPGFMNDDGLTWPLRRFLSGLGYTPHPWRQGVSRRPMLSYLEPLLSTAETLAADAPLLLVGYSRGGVLAREMARERPHWFRGVVTIASPIRGGPQATSIGAFAARQTGMPIEVMRRLQRERARVPIQVPMVSLYSKTDGIVAWQACIDEVSAEIEHVEVQGSHAGMLFNPQVYKEVARSLDRLATRQQPDDGESK